MDKTGLGIGIMGGMGLGLLLGREFAGSYVTLLGALLIIICLSAMGIQFYHGKK